MHVWNNYNGAIRQTLINPKFKIWVSFTNPFNLDASRVVTSFNVSCHTSDCALHYAMKWLLFSFLSGILILLGNTWIRARIRVQDGARRHQTNDEYLTHQWSSQVEDFRWYNIWLSNKQGKHNLLSAHIWFQSIWFLYYAYGSNVVLGRDLGMCVLHSVVSCYID